VRRTKRWTTATAALLTAALVSPAAASSIPRSARHVRHLSGHTWRYQAQVDGSRAADRVVIVGGKDLTVGRFQPDEGFGHFTVHVQLAGSAHAVSSRQFTTYVSVRKPWTPWLGATDLDQRGGKEILVGFSTGTLQSFRALSYRGGRLVRLSSPVDSTWSVGEVSFNDYGGWVCTGGGVERRWVSPTSSSSKHYRIVHDRYAFRSGAWVRTRHSARTVPATASGQPPAYTARFVKFGCPGLPKKII
jgi:hypothetical protein